MIGSTSKTSLLLSASLCALCAGAALAADSSGSNVIEEVTVTARRVRENIQATPLSVSALSGLTLRDRDVVRLADISTFTPNVKVTEASSGSISPLIYIRGIGTVSTVLYAEPAVGVYVDGVYAPRMTGNEFDLPDMDHIEVLRGPQGTLFGRNTTGGAIQITTRQPTHDAGGTVSFSVGTEAEFIEFAVLNTGDIGNTGLRAKLMAEDHTRDGWVNFPGRDASHWGGSLNDRDFALDLVWDILDNFSAENRAHYNNVRAAVGWQDLTGTPAALAYYSGQAAKNGGPPFIVGMTPQDIAYRDPRIPTDAWTHSYGDGLTLNYAVSPALQLKSITAFNELDENLTGELGGSYILGTVINPVNKTSPVEPVSVHSTPQEPGKQRQLSQELQASGTLGEFNYVGGFFYWDERVTENVTTILNSVLSPASAIRVNKSVTYTLDTTSWAGFGQVGYRPHALGDRFELNVGVRYSDDKKTQFSNTVQTTLATTNVSQFLNDEFHNLGWSATASYRVTPDVMVYARGASGYRSGGFNAIATGYPGFGPETDVSYEFGVKSDFLDHRIRLNADVFHTNYDNLQINQYNTTTLTSYIVNAGQAHFEGFEGELTALLGYGFQFNANYGYVNPRYDKYTFLIGGQPSDVSKAAGFPFVSRNTGSLGIQFKSELTDLGLWTLRADYGFQTGYHFASIDVVPGTTANLAPNNQKVTSGDVRDLSLHASLSDIPLGGWATYKLSLYGNNLLDHRYLLYATDFASLMSGTFNRPRSFGGGLTVNF